jgi:hypothetical protein
MYPHYEINIPANVPGSKAGFGRMALDVKIQKPQYLLRSLMGYRILLDRPEQANGGGCVSIELPSAINSQ